MLGLFFTTLLSIFCCSSINLNAIDYTKEISINDSKPIQNVVYQEDYMIMTQADLLSSDTAFFFVSGLVDAGYIGFSVTAEYDYSLTLQTDGKVYNGWSEPDPYTASKVDVDSIVINKTYAGKKTVSNSTYYSDVYAVVFNLHDGNTYTVTWFIEAFWSLVQPYVWSSYNGAFTGGTALVFTYIEDEQFGTNHPFLTYTYDYLENYSANASTVYNEGYNDGYYDGKTNGYQSGYNAGYDDGVNIDTQTATIFAGILDIGLLPVNVFLQILNFEVFGINISGFVSALLTISIVIIIVRFLFGGGNSDK